MTTQTCLVQDCQGKVYAPTGTGHLCKEHFLDFVKWRRRKGLAMFNKYAGMRMDERDAVAVEWAKTLNIQK